jgi:peptidoglycan/xylan/chitin deacetylase (PgdA/CDA1 family)
MRQRDDHPAPERPRVSRRVVLVASGGLMLGVATAVGWPGGLTGGTLGQGRSSPRVSEAARVASTEAPRRPASHRKTTHPTSHQGTGHQQASPPTHVTGGIAPAEPVYYLDDGPKAIALTIDDGPSPVYTPQILRILEKHRVTASFSMIGESVGYYPGIARDVADAGHVIVNHTWDHANLAQMSASRTRTEIASATDAIHAAVGELPRMFRAPYGAWSRAALEYCASEKLMPLDWSVDPRDWARPGVGEIIRAIMRNTQTGSIILEHDGGGDRSQTVVALKTAIPRLLDEGYHFRTPTWRPSSG